MQFLIPSSAFLLCLVATPVVRRISLRKGWIAYPSKQRWHKKPTALLGGVAIYFGIGTALFFMADFSTLLPHFFRTFRFCEFALVGRGNLAGYDLFIFFGAFG